MPLPLPINFTLKIFITLLFLVLLTCLLYYLLEKRWWMFFVPCAKIKSSQVINSNSFHYPSQPLNDFTITHQFYIENIYNATISSLADLLALLFAREEISSKCAFDSKFKRQLILLSSLFLLLFVNPIAYFATIHESYYTISVNFPLYVHYFQQKVFSFSKISKS